MIDDSKKPVPDRIASNGWDGVDWKALERLRNAFLTAEPGAGDYWQSARDVLSYDLTFGQRIAWKWDYVLQELRRHGWTPPPGEVFDWGCGSGIAGRRFVGFFGASQSDGLVLWDRSALASGCALRLAQRDFPALPSRVEAQAKTGTLVVSHVLTELPADQLELILNLAQAATAIVWVEPGTYQASRALITLRERLRPTFQVVAPCTHQAYCGLLVPENERHWCHHFATVPPEVFTDPGWSRFTNLTGIDLRSLPLSFLVLDRRPVPASPPETVRVIGHPRIYKGYALLFGCEVSGVLDGRLTQRHLPEIFRSLKKEAFHPLQIWRRQGNEIVQCEPWAPGPAAEPAK